MSKTTGPLPAGRRLVGTLLGVALMLCLPQAAVAAQRTDTGPTLARGEGYALAEGSGQVRALQRRLRGLGERPGPVDGRYGPLTEAAVRQLQARTGVAVDGIVGPRTRAALRRADPRPLVPGTGYGDTGGSASVKGLQRRLRAAGLRVGPIDGIFGPRTEAAVRTLQARRNLVVDGVVGARTRAALAEPRARSGTRRAADRPDKPEPEGSSAESDGAAATRADRAGPETTATPAGEAIGGDDTRPAAESTRPSEDGGELPWIVALGVAGFAAALALLARALRHRGPSHQSRPPRVVPLANGVALEGTSPSPEIGAFKGTAYAVEVQDAEDARERAEGSRFFVLDSRREAPFWVDYEDVETPLPLGLSAYSEPWEQKSALGAGSAVLGYITVPKDPAASREAFDEQIARIEQVCERRGFRLVSVVRDVDPNGESPLERPGIVYALQQFEERKASGLVVCDAFRLGRTRAQVDELLDRLASTGTALLTLEPELVASTEESREVVRKLAVGRFVRGRPGEEPSRGERRPGKARPAARTGSPPGGDEA